MIERVEYSAYAKINLGLNVLHKRNDGYHEIETIFQQISLADKIEIMKMAGAENKIQIECAHSLVPNNEKNICYLAASLLLNKFGITQNFKIKITKNIPVGAGLGGGSSDAAVVLMGLNRLCQLDLTQVELQDSARKIGADVSFFIYGGTMLATGIGEILEPVKLPLDYQCVLIYPDISISTPWVYKNFKINLTNTKKKIKLASLFFRQIHLDEFAYFFKNDLEDVVFPDYPKIRELKTKLLDTGALFASMSGSGSSVFGIFPPDFKFAHNFAENFNPEYDIYHVSPL
jgi:4-diphosphocytidyl-2-C-methyl-D-erythritol kinase